MNLGQLLAEEILNEGKIYLYRHIRLDKNEPFYIGIGSDKPSQIGTYKRAYNFKVRSNSWKTIGNFIPYRVEILLENMTWEQACEKEIEFIKLYGRRDKGLGPLTNLTDGGEGVYNPSQETRDKKSKSMTGKIMHNDDSKKNISDNMKLAWKNNPNLAKRIIPKEKISSRKFINQYDLEGNFLKEWRGLGEAADKLGLNRRGICNCCLNVSKTSGGFIWKYKE